MEAIVTHLNWQQVSAFTSVIIALGSMFNWIRKNSVRKSDIDDLKDDLITVRESNTSENNRIMAAVDEVKAEVKEDIQEITARFDRHIDKGDR